MCVFVHAYKTRTGINPVPVHPATTCEGKGLLETNQSPHHLCPFFTQTLPQTSPQHFTLPQTPRPAPLILIADSLPCSPDSYRGRQSHQGGVGDLPAASAAPPALPAPPLQAGAGRYSSCPSFPLLIPACNSDFHPSWSWGLQAKAPLCNSVIPVGNLNLASWGRCSKRLVSKELAQASHEVGTRQALYWAF